MHKTDTDSLMSDARPYKACTMNIFLTEFTLKISRRTKAKIKYCSVARFPQSFQLPTATVTAL